MEVVNDNNCSWVKDLSQRNNIKTLSSNLNCEWLIIGAGYTGLSAARKLGQLYPNQKILLVDAQLAGEGASSRNSGYLVDTTLNDGFTSNKELSNYKKKTDIYKLGIDTVKKFIKEHQVDCDWNECGKYFASSNTEDKNILKSVQNKYLELLIKLKNEKNFELLMDKDISFQFLTGISLPIEIKRNILMLNSETKRLIYINNLFKQILSQKIQNNENNFPKA